MLTVSFDQGEEAARFRNAAAKQKGVKMRL